MKIRLQIDTLTFVRFWLVVFGFSLALLAIYGARNALIVIGTAFFLALALNAPVSLFARHLPGRSRVLSTAIAYVAVLGFLGLFIFLVIPPMLDQIVRFTNTLPMFVEDVTRQWSGINDLIVKYHMQDQVDQAVLSVKNNVSDWAAGLGTDVVAGLGSLASTFAAAILIIVMTFLMLVEGPSWMSRLWNLYTDKDKMEYHHSVVHRMYQVVNGYVTGQLTVSAIDGFTAGLTVFLLSLFLNVPANLALPAAAILFILSMIPMFGATIGGTIVTLLLLFNDATAAIIFLIYFIIYQQLENNLISPTIQAKKLELSPLAVLVAVTIGLYVFGIVGGIISIPIAGCIKVLAEEYLNNARVQREKSTPLKDVVKKLNSKKLATDKTK